MLVDRKSGKDFKTISITCYACNHNHAYVYQKTVSIDCENGHIHVDGKMVACKNCGTSKMAKMNE